MSSLNFIIYDIQYIQVPTELILPMSFLQFFIKYMKDTFLIIDLNLF